MVSQRQLEANLANARRSTGPKSALGKARSRMNAVTHGLTAKQIVVRGEQPEKFDAFREALFSDFKPSVRIRRRPTAFSRMQAEFGARTLRSFSRSFREKLRNPKARCRRIFLFSTQFPVMFSIQGALKESTRLRFGGGIRP
jgi:hypothetical protein